MERVSGAIARCDDAAGRPTHPAFLRRPSGALASTHGWSAPGLVAPLRRRGELRRHDGANPHSMPYWYSISLSSYCCELPAFFQIQKTPQPFAKVRRAIARDVSIPSGIAHQLERKVTLAEIERHDVGAGHVGWAERDAHHRVGTPLELELLGRPLAHPHAAVSWTSEDLGTEL